MIRKFSLIVIFLIGSIGPAYGKEFPVPLQQRKAREGLQYLLSRDYPGLEKFLKQLDHEWPGALLGEFGWMVYYQVRNLENFDFRFDPPYRPLQERVRPRALAISRAGEEGRGGPPWDELIAGGILGISGFYHAHNKRWFQALRDGSRGVHTMERAFKRDPTLADALLGVGLNDYWRSHFTRKLRFLPFFPDRRRQGIELIQVAEERGTFVGPVARISLAFIDVQEKRYDRILETTLELLQRYPKNIILRFLQGQTLAKMKRIPEAIQEFEKILAIDRTMTKAQEELTRLKRK